MPAMTPETTVGEVVRQRPALSRLFESLRIDYCSGGRKTLADACAARGLDVSDVLRRLDEADDSGDADADIDADALGLSELVDHIVATHHERLRRELPRLDAMTRKVAAVHGRREPRLHEIRRVFVSCRDELHAHMLKEEHVLFPMIRALERRGGATGSLEASIAGPIRMMEREHDDAGDALEQFRELTDGYTVPAGACNTWRAMFDALADLERDMHVHVHKENNILFPRALRFEAERRAGTGVRNRAGAAVRDAGDSNV